VAAVGLYLLIFILGFLLELAAPSFARNREAVGNLTTILSYSVGMPAMIFLLDRSAKTLVHHRFNQKINHFIGWSLFWRIGCCFWLIAGFLVIIAFTLIKVFPGISQSSVWLWLKILLVSIGYGLTILTYGVITKRVVISKIHV